jgi:hypothetical protein
MPVLGPAQRKPVAVEERKTRIAIAWKERVFFLTWFQGLLCTETESE